MAFRFTVLASGSAGNASLLEVEGFGLLLDAGLGPRQLAARMTAVDVSWRQVHAVLLTHTHSDHWNERTLASLGRRRIPLYCHSAHQEQLKLWSAGFGQLQEEQLVHFYEPGQDFQPVAPLRCRALPLRHDAGPTFGFRFEGPGDLFGHGHALAYAADLGSWTPELARALADVDVLALEFNHDVAMQHGSGRAPYLIARILGDHGHLSNPQAGALVQEIVRLSAPGRLRHVIQLHLSRECNRPHLAAEAAWMALPPDCVGVQVHTASQDEPGPSLLLDGAAGQRRRSVRIRSRRTAQPSAPAPQWLPGFEG